MEDMNINYANVILDEICLEGLDGITLQALWFRITVRLEHEVPDSLKKRFWNIVIRLKEVNFYQLPEPRGDLLPFDRFDIVDKIYVLKSENLPDPQMMIYPYVPVKDAHGSCQHFKSRIDITSVIRLTTLEDAIERWGNSLVIVGAMEARWRALAPFSPPVFDNITQVQFRLLERIGRTRYNGDTSFGIAGQIPGEDPKSLFHHRKILLSLNLIVKKNFTQKNVATWRLLHLLRFNRPYMSDGERVVEGVVRMLKDKPNKTASYQEVRDYVLLNKMIPKNLIKLGEYVKRIRSVALKYKDMYPEKIKPNSTNNSLIRGFQLKEVVEEEKEDVEEEDLEVSGSGFVGESLLRQVYMCMHASGPEGITQRELCEKIGIDHLTARNALKYIGTRCNIHQSMIDIRRQRISKFTCPEFVGKSSNEFIVENKKRKTILMDPDQNIKLLDKEPNADKRDESNIHNESSSSAQVDESLTELSPNDPVGKNNYMTATKLRRAKLIMDQLRERHIIYDISNLLKICNQQENKLGFTNGLIDKKSIMRILTRLESEGQLRLITVKLNLKVPSKLLFICQPHIDAEHSYIKSVVEQAKMFSISTNSKAAETKPNPSSLMNLEAKKEYGYVPKFCKMRILHEFLFYIMLDHKKKKYNLQDSPLQHQIKDLLPSEISTAYDNAPDKYLFVPPAPTHANWPQGWMLLADLLLCMPLYIFLKIQKVPVFSDGIAEYAQHPLKCQILVKNLPKEFQNILFEKRRHIFSIYTVTERLCLFGLLKFGQRLMKEKDRVFIYLNRNISLLDTTKSAPSYYIIENKTYTRESFHLQTMNDLYTYWNRLQVVCLNTLLGFSKVAIGQRVEIQTAEAKLANEFKCFSVGEAKELDNGSIPGDGRGAGGMDSSLFTHIRRCWVTQMPVKPIKRKQAEKMSAQMSAIPRKIPKISRGEMGFLKLNKKKGKYSVRTIAPRKLSRIRKPFCDPVDAIALKNLTSLRSYWQPKEDRILVLAKTAVGVMFSNSRLAPASLIRDMLHVGTHIANKTSAACRRRLLYMSKNTQISHNIRLCLAEVKQKPFIQQKYYQLYSRTRVIESHPKYADFVKEYKIHFIELVQYLHKIVYGSSVDRSSLTVLPHTLAELHLKYFIDLTQLSPLSPLTEPKKIGEIKENALTSIIHSALSCKTGKQSQAYHLLQIYRQFSESFLRETIVKIKSSEMFAMTKKYKDNTCLSSYTTSFHLSQAYLYQLCTTTPFTIFSEIFGHFSEIIENQDKCFVPTMLDSGATALLFDLASTGFANLELTIPENILILDPKRSDLTCSINPSNESGNSSLIVEEDKLHPSRISLSSLQLLETPIPHIQDMVVMNSCDLKVTFNCNLKDKFNISLDEITDIFTDLMRNFVYKLEPIKVDITLVENCDLCLAKLLFNFIDEKTHMGAETRDIKKMFSTYSKLDIENALFALKEKNYIFRVGICNSRWLSVSYFYHWFIKIEFDPEIIPANETTQESVPDDLDNFSMSCQKRKRDDGNDDDDDLDVIAKVSKVEEVTRLCSDQIVDMEEMYGNANESEDCNEGKRSEVVEEIFDIRKHLSKTFLCPSPWVTPDGILNIRILWRWIGTILCYLICHPLIQFTLLQKRFSYVNPFHLRLLLEMTTKMGCTQLILIPINKKVSLFEDDISHEFTKVNASPLDDNEDIYVEIQENAITRCSIYKGLSKNYKKGT